MSEKSSVVLVYQSANNDTVVKPILSRSTKLLILNLVMETQNTTPAVCTNLVIDLTEGQDVTDVDGMNGLDREKSNTHPDQNFEMDEKTNSRETRRSGEPTIQRNEERLEGIVKSSNRHLSPGSSLGISAGISIPPPSRGQPQQLPTVSLVSTDTVNDNSKVQGFPHYELLAISSRESHQATNSNHSIATDISEEHGLFATRFIREGTRIICEAPLLSLPVPGNGISALRAAFEQLTKDDQAKVWNLKASTGNASEQLRTLGKVVQPVLALVVAILNTPEQYRTTEERMELDLAGPKLERALEDLRLAARWHANQCSLINLPEGERDRLPPGQPITALFLEAGQLRHSCVPNCYAGYNSAADQITVGVTRDVQPGEELTASLIADKMYYDQAERRQQRLLDECGIKCACEACDTSHPNFKIHEEARLCAFGRAVMLNSDDVSSNDIVSRPRCCAVPIAYLPR